MSRRRTQTRKRVSATRVDTPIACDPSVSVVSQHAVHRARERCDAFRGRDDDTVRRELVRRLAEAVGKGQVYTNPPRQFRPRYVGPHTNGLPPWQRYVVSGEVGFVVDVTMQPVLTVVTVYQRLRNPDA